MLNFYNAYNSIRTNKPKGSYINDFNAIVEQTFDNAPNIFYDEIEFEYEYGSNIFRKVPKVRVDSVTPYNSSMLVNGDDYKIFIFMPDFPKPVYGMKFKWGEDYWLVINTNNKESINITAEVRKCNNVLRFFDFNGNKIYEPCIMDTTLRFTNNQVTGVITTGKEEQKIWCQRNSRTTTIKPNDKFLFGTPNQRYALRLYAGGMKNEINTTTMDDNSSTLTEFYLEHYQINPELDDLVSGFANAYLYDLNISINNLSNIYELNTTGVLTATVTKNNDIINSEILWDSSNPSVFDILEDGSFVALSVGNAIIKASMADNLNIYEEVEISVEEVPLEDDYKIILMPDVDYILQNKELNFTCYLYKNGEKLLDTFVFADVSVNVPKDKYIINNIQDNSFTILSKGMYMNAPILVRCTSGLYTKIVPIYLRGLY